ncbi:hypothetical protein PsorP6_009039 [Peronosclerospora sorghi]|uniref:Uncharacterized protein n=1 Tax=Peronosclerospora sorghi TaxID=230839 RepID=A0ACC0VXW7_9STRA|nr:hypothetical protein PsorP6_009039 [Peronosclerospora sorghi]
MRSKGNFAVAYTVDQLKQRWLILKRNYNTVKRIRDNSGLVWDYENQVITCSDDVWEEYVTNHPVAGPWRTTSFPLFDSIGKIISGAVASGSSSLRPEAMFFVQENHLDDDTDDELTLRRSGALQSGNSLSRDSVVANTEPQRFSSASSPNSRPASQLAGSSAASSAPSTSSTSHILERAPIPGIPRRKRTQYQRDELASAVASLAEASNRRSDAREAASIRQKSRIEEAMELLEATSNEDSDVNNTLDALSILQNESQATIYITMKNRALREAWLQRKIEERHQ